MPATIRKNKGGYSVRTQNATHGKNKHWSQTMKNKKGKTVTVGGHVMGKNMAAMKKGSRIGAIKARAKGMC